MAQVEGKGGKELFFKRQVPPSPAIAPQRTRLRLTSSRPQKNARRRFLYLTAGVSHPRLAPKKRMARVVVARRR